MPPENFVLSSCTLDDLPAIITVHRDAFADDPISKYAFPRETIGETEQVRWMTDFLTGHFRKPEMTFFKITETNTGNLVAWVRCQVPHVLSEEEREKRKEEKERKLRDGNFWPKGANLEVIEATFGTLAKLAQKYVNDAETYYVQVLATAPAYQRRGLGSMLLKHVLQMADKEGRVAYIEATDAGYPLYLRLGWKQIDIVELDLSKFGGKGTSSNRIMLREAQRTL